MNHDSRPIIIDLSCKDGDPSSACQHKVQFLTGISWEFASAYEANSNEQIVLRNDRGSMTLVSASLMESAVSSTIQLNRLPLVSSKFA